MSPKYYLELLGPIPPIPRTALLGKPKSALYTSL
jgi:hypothetical protein